MDLNRRVLTLLTVPVSALLMLMNLLSPPPPAELTTVLAGSDSSEHEAHQALPVTAPIAPPTATAAPATATPTTPIPTAHAPVETGYRFVTIPDVESGWVIVDDDDTGQWLSPECRIDLGYHGAYFEIVPWEVIERTALPSIELPCDEVAQRAFGVPNESSTQGEPLDTAPSPDPSMPTQMDGGPQLERGINLAGDFEVAPRGSWGSPIELSDLDVVAAAGFDHVRIPIRWSAHTGPAPTHTIDPTFFAEVDAVVQRATEVGLSVMVNVHHFEELDADPIGERAHFLAIWDQIGRAYADAPSTVVFELLNEPAGVFLERPDLWNELAADALAVVRRTNPIRTVVIGPVNYNHPSKLYELVLPNDPNVTATIHTYDPASFTHQGAVWSNPVPPTGQTWEPSTRRIGYDWYDLSWGVELDERTDGVSLVFEERFMALAMGRDETITPANQLVLSANRAFDGVILCNYNGADQVTVDVVFDSSLQGTADLSACGPIRALAVQTVEDGRSEVTLSRLALCSATCDELIITEAEALARQLRDAAGWADIQGVELYLGEFGTFDPTGTPTDVRSRIEWTRTVRELSEEFGIGWGAFSFTGEFGFYDRERGAWDSPLLGALLD